MDLDLVNNDSNSSQDQVQYPEKQKQKIKDVIPNLGDAQLLSKRIKIYLRIRMEQLKKKGFEYFNFINIRF